MAAAARWSDIPQDVLFLILRRLILVDYVRFGAVCSSWHSAMRARRYPSAPQRPPWLMFPGPDSDPSAANFLSLSRHGRCNKVHTLRLPFADLRDRWIVGSSHGWLITVDRRCVASMLNPITGAQILLPPVSTFPDVEAELDSSGAVTRFTFSPGHCPSYSYAPDELCDFYFSKIIVEPGPAGISAGDYTAVAIAHGDLSSPAFARGGDNKWTSLRLLHPAKFDDVIYHNGLFYGIAHPGKMVAYDLSGPIPEVKSVTAKYRDSSSKIYGVESSGDLLMILRSRTKKDETKVQTYKVEVLKLNDDKQWVEVKSLGDQALFLGLTGSISLSAVEFPQLKGNCIYFTDDCQDNMFVHRPSKRDTGVYNLEDGTMSMELLRPYHYGLNWPPSLWITPHI